MKRAIAGRRGSVRGAPPEVYAGFMQMPGTDEEQLEQLQPAITFFKTIFLTVPAILIGGWIMLALIYGLAGKNILEP